MAVTTIDPKTALIVIDLQSGIVGMPTAHPIEDVISNSRVLADAFRSRGLPVVLVNVDAIAPGRTEQASRSVNFPDGWTELVPELGRRPDDITVTKRTWGVFASTDLAERLKARGVTHVVITGVATTAGVESTARQAYELGFNVTLATDAMTDRNAEAHDNSVTHIFPRLGETGSTADIIALLDPSA